MNTKGKGIVIAIVVLLIVGFMVWRGGQTEGPATLKIGLMSPLSGEYAVAGENYQKGVELALEEYRKKNPDANIELVVEDDGFVVSKGMTAYKKLKDIDDIDTLIMLSTPVIDAIHEEVKQTDLIVMQLGIQTTGVADDNIFQTSPSPEAPIALFADYLEDNYDFENVAVVYDNTAGGNTFLTAFEGAYEKPYGKFVINQQTDIRNIALSVNGENHDAVAVLTSPENGAILVKEIMNIDSTPPLFAFDAQLQTGFADYERILGDATILDGSISMWIASGDSDEFKALYQNKYETEPGFIADFGYDTFNILMENYDADKEQWMVNIQSHTGNGPSGSIAFDENGIRIQDIVMNKVVNGVIVPIE